MKDDQYYIWRTAKDSKVRSSHADREGKKFKWSEPPTGGHPGEAYGCRCWAEAFHNVTGLKQEISNIKNASSKWGILDFGYHAYFKNGTPVTLAQIGWLADIINKTQSLIFPRIEEQIANLMREQGMGTLNYETKRSYPEFIDIYWIFGGGTISSKTTGYVTKDGNKLSIDAKVSYTYYDDFTDYADLRERILGTSDRNSVPKALYNNPSTLIPYIILRGKGLINSNNPVDAWINATDFSAQAFKITGSWETRLTGSIELEATQ